MNNFDSRVTVDFLLPQNKQMITLDLNLKSFSADEMSLFFMKYFMPPSYTVLHIFVQVLFWAENQNNHQNFGPSLLPKKIWLIFMGMKQKKSKWWTQKTWFFNFTISLFFAKISGICPWMITINWCKGRWCGLTFMVVRLSDVSSKTG